MKIPYVNLNLQWQAEKNTLLKLIDKSLSEESWVGGNSIQKFEKNISNFCQTKYAAALNSGTDALTLALHLLGVRKGDEVITTPNTFIATVSVIVHLGAIPIFVDVLPDQSMDASKLENLITKKTKAIIPVYLSGRIEGMNKIKSVAKKYKIPIIEDAAQAIGSFFYDKPSGSIGDIGCFSAHPLKNLNAFGDSGYITTNSKKIYKKIIELRNHGMIKRDKVNNFGYVSRMDNLQATVLNYRLRNLRKIIAKRRENFKIYKKFLNRDFVFFPDEKPYQFNSYHTFVVQVNKRDKLKNFLKLNKIDTAIHYPVPIHLQPAAKYLGYKKGSFINAENQAKKILTLPINQFLDEKQIKFISYKINTFFEKK